MKPLVLESKKPAFFYGYVIVLAAFFVLMIIHALIFSFGIFIKPISTEFGWLRATISGAYSTDIFVMGFLFIITGKLNDRFGPRAVVTVCGLLLGLGVILTSQIRASWQLYLFWGVIAAMGMSGGSGPMTSTVARWFAKRRGMMTGIVVSGVGAGSMIGPP